MLTLAIPSHGSDQLTLTAQERYRWLAVLNLGGLEAKALVENGPAVVTGRTIAHLFVELADHWRGWDGDRVWANNEKTPELAARHDGLGHVVLAIVLRERAGPGWEAHGTLQLLAGELDSIARDAERFDQGQAATDGRPSDAARMRR